MRIARIEREDGPRTALVADDRLHVLTEDAVLTGSPAGDAATTATGGCGPAT
jgi:Rv2993c-like, N-terminal